MKWNFLALILKNFKKSFSYIPGNEIPEIIDIFSQGKTVRKKYHLSQSAANLGIYQNIFKNKFLKKYIFKTFPQNIFKNTAP